MRPAPPPAMPPPYTRPYPWLPVTRLRVGRVLLLALLTGALLIGGTVWLLTTKARPFVTPTVDSTAWPVWLRQVQTYPVAEVEPPRPAAPAPDPNTALLAKLGLFQAELERQRQELEALKKRPAGTTIVPPPQTQAAKVTPPPKTNASMLFVAHELKDPPPAPKAIAYTLAPGATKLLCIVETAINSDVEGYFTAKVSTKVFQSCGSAPLDERESNTIGLLISHEDVGRPSHTRSTPVQHLQLLYSRLKPLIPTVPGRYARVVSTAMPFFLTSDMMHFLRIRHLRKCV